MPYPGQYDGQDTQQVEYEDIELNCSCGVAFIWTKGEQKFLNNLVAEGKIREVKQPMRCPDCRAKKKAAMAQRGY